MVDIKTEIWREELAIWLDGFPWQWFCTLTFRPGLSEPQARWRLRTWLGDLKGALGTPDFGWWATREFGRTRSNIHYHVLVKGLRDWGADARVEWMKRWGKLGGDPRIDLFIPGARGTFYILKNAQPHDPDAIDFEIPGHTQMQTTLDEQKDTASTPVEVASQMTHTKENRENERRN